MKKLNKLKNLEEKISKKEEQVKLYLEKIEQEKEKLIEEEKNILYKHFKSQKMPIKEYMSLLEELFSDKQLKQEKEIREDDSYEEPIITEQKGE